MRQPLLRTDRLELVPLSDDHLEDEIVLDADPAVMRYLGDGRPRGREAVVAAHARRLTRAVRGLGVWAGLVEGVFAGWWCLDPDDTGTDEAELGYRLLPRFWRQGLAGEGARELVRYAFDDLQLVRVFARTMAVNTGSRATMAAAGLVHVRSFHEKWETPIPGAEHGEVEYALSRGTWQARVG